jgi:hypothetical protein
VFGYRGQNVYSELDLSVNAIIAYLEAVERLDPQIVRDAIDDLNPAERARRYH